MCQPVRMFSEEVFQSVCQISIEQIVGTVGIIRVDFGNRILILKKFQCPCARLAGPLQ